MILRSLSGTDKSVPFQNSGLSDFSELQGRALTRNPRPSLKSSLFRPQGVYGVYG